MLGPCPSRPQRPPLRGPWRVAAGVRQGESRRERGQEEQVVMEGWGGRSGSGGEEGGELR